MLADGVVDEVKRLLEEGALSQRKIAARVGVSRGSVNAIARGKRPDYGARRRGGELVVPSGRPARCPTCGGLVQMPCLACRIRALRESGRRSPRAPLDRRAGARVHPPAR